jgi:hypothetical protein
MIDLDRDLTIFVIAVFVFFICPIGLVLTAIVADQWSADQSATNRTPDR